MNKKIFQLSLISLGLVHLSACDLFGGDDKNTPPEIVTAIEASIGERSFLSGGVTISDSDGSISSRTIKQTSGPDVIDLTLGDSSLSFTAPEVTEDTKVAFLITATDDDGDNTEKEVSVTIKQINRAPLITGSEHSLEYNNTLEFTLDVKDEDGDALEVTFEPALSGVVELINATTQTYSYTPTHNNITKEILHFGVSDGDLTNSAEVQIEIIDTSAPRLITSLPESSATRVSLTGEIQLHFDDNMSASWSSEIGTSECNGAIHLRESGNQTCVEFSVGQTQQEDGYAFAITPMESLKAGTEYELTISETVTNFYGTAIAQAEKLTFVTGQKDLLITEISSSRYIDDNRWVEIYNGTNETIDLSNYQLVAESIELENYNDGGTKVFPLKSQLLEPGEYIVVQNEHGPQTWQRSVTSSNQLMLVGDGQFAPAWYISGYVELQNKQGETVDFVRFGESDKAPATPSEWQESAKLLPVSNQLGQSLVRTSLLTDTNSISDWQSAAFFTPGGNNDVLCDKDEDLDGIPDCSEQPGGTFAGLPLYEWGARAGVRDIFIEVDYMESNDAGITPHKPALDKVKAAFAAQDIAVHFDVGNLYHQAEGLSLEQHDLGGGEQIPFVQTTTFASSEQAPSILDHKAKHFDLKRRPIFHYMLMANSQKEDGSQGSSGLAELFGNDLIISLGNWGLNVDSEIAANVTYSYQAGTIMHELGHNLGLYHGGNENVNFKPNHVSVMNYLYQLDGLATVGNKEGDRYLSRWFYSNENCFPKGTALVNSPTEGLEHFIIDYSHGHNKPINEANIDESKGLNNDKSEAVDFDCNGSSSDLLTNFDLNGDNENTSVLNDYDEWSSLILNFAQFWSGANSGHVKQNMESRAQKSIMHSDRQAVQEESEPSPAVFEQIKRWSNYQN
ncbi:Ig-like domain-containing protein [Pseudoalteromonas sp. OANN1]|uniref:Ig-like domain-containing protein n=1 Tax=Pseudoalteromonas sp. OANN1 TaxID=2954497 RepID=UPI0020969DD0|nr:Ig-like domain-containing protein [Pseudoalteromonas sp. OANN1]MCO7200491.1 Ig-like domain-containing protein [Pseudoalteromonas sp. OANN1]